ncbi:MAG: tRNA-dihydrouridine synthase family protein [Candidatus Saccharibacteria bacterium]|nr:tRNA-dihydrouridine synthase family protein [Candidatus Saccharibacteria bacterium]
MNNIWQELDEPIMILAPMEGVTDVMFRQVIARAGRPDLFFTEFTNVSSYASEKGRSNALERLEVVESDKPIIAQIWGKNPEHFSETCQALASLGFSGVDLNFGCPDKHVNKAGGGAAMIRTPELAVECLKNAKNSTDLPVSVKTRLGYSKPEEFREWLPVILKEHPVALTVHLRTKKEMSKVPAHYGLIPEIVGLRDEIGPETKLIINGDIRDKKHAMELYKEYPGVDGFMIGRGVFANPYCFTDHEATREELMELLNLHLDLYEKQSEKYYISYEPLKHFFKIYINNFPGAKELRAKLMETHSVDEARAVIQGL